MKLKTLVIYVAVSTANLLCDGVLLLIQTFVAVKCLGKHLAKICKNPVLLGKPTETFFEFWWELDDRMYRAREYLEV